MLRVDFQVLLDLGNSTGSETTYSSWACPHYGPVPGPSFRIKEVPAAPRRRAGTPVYTSVRVAVWVARFPGVPFAFVGRGEKGAEFNLQTPTVYATVHATVPTFAFPVLLKP